MGNKQRKLQSHHSDGKRVETKVGSSATENNVNTQRTKTLILGSGSVGKTTIFKSIHLAFQDIHISALKGSGPREFEWPTINDIKDTKQRSRLNAVQGLLVLLDKTNDTLSGNDIPLFVDTIKSFRSQDFEEQGASLNAKSIESLGHAIHSVWNLDAIQNTFKLRLQQKYAFTDNMEYFYAKIKEIMKPSYVATTDDCLRVRIRTTGIDEHQYTDGSGNVFGVFDVGGERSERRKWVHAFDAVDCVMFVCALNQYCLSIFEDEKVSGLDENIALWEEIAKSRYFVDTKFVLVFNKTDLFKEFLMATPLTFCFGDEYKGRNYNDMHPMKFKVICRVILQLLFVDEDDVKCTNDIPKDIVSLVTAYCDQSSFIYQDWLDSVYADGLQFIKDKYLSIRSDVSVCEICAVDPKQVRPIVDDIRAAFSASPIN